MDGHSAIVTGDAQNIGAAIARSFAGAGAKVAIAYLNGDAARSTAQEIATQTGGDVIAYSADSFVNFFSAAATLNLGVRARGERLAIVTNAGGPAVMAVDCLSDKHLHLARLSSRTVRRLNGFLPTSWSHSNSVDVLGDADPERFSEALAACLEDTGVDAVLAVLTPQAMTEPEQVAERVVGLAGGSNKPVFTAWMGESSVASSRAVFRKHKVPTYRTPEAAVESFAVAAAYHENQQLLLQVPEPLDTGKAVDLQGAHLIVDGVLADHRRVLTLAESKALLAAFRIPVLQSIPAQGPSDAPLVAKKLGFPVVLKIDSPDITHKSDVGGIELNVRSAEDVPAAVRELLRRVAANAPEARISGVLVEPMEGVVLAENYNMLKFAEANGFRILPDPDDASVVTISLDL